MGRHRIGSLAGLLGLALAGGAAAEEPIPDTIWGSVEAGAYLSTEDSYQWGDYTGIKDDAWYGLANVELHGRAPWTSEDTWHFDFQGSNLALDSRFLSLSGGLQGLFSVWVEWDQIPLYDDDTASLVFLGRGTDTLTLPSNWVPAGTTAGFTALDTDLRRLNLSRDRYTLTAGADVVLPRGLALASEYQWQKVEGRKVTGAVIGNSGGNPRSSLLPAHVDWQTHQSDTALRFANETAQLELGYQNSYFDDLDDTLTWQNPFAAINGWDPAAGYPSGFGRKGLPPDNQFHQVYGSGGYNLPWWRTRVAGQASFAWYRQDDDFLPYTVNPALTVTTPLPRGDANGEIDATNVLLRVTSRPLDALRLTASYRLDDRDNDTPRDVYIYVPGDSLDQDTIDSDRARMNLPNSYRLQEGRLDLTYEVWRRTEVSAGYERQRETRSWTETDQLDDDIVRVGLRSRALSWADFRVDGTWWRRDAGDYFYQAPAVWGFSPEHVATVPSNEQFENVPPMRKFNYTDRDRGSVDARLLVMPVDAATLGFSLGWATEDYDASELGLRQRDVLSWGIDASWNPTETVTTYLWFQDQRYESQVRGRQWTGTVDAFDPRFDWKSDDEDDVKTVGLGAEWTGFEERLSLRADYAFSWAKERIHTNAGPALPATAPFPDARQMLHDVSFQAQVRIREGLVGRFGYLYEYLDVNDWAYDDVGPATVPEVLGLGQSMPDYGAHLFAFSLEYQFAFGTER
jgi:MtrB/PioB family decaheme-associated outer membrane protein